MELLTVYIGTLENVISFVKITDQLDARMYFTSEHTRVNAKSLLGILSTDFYRPKQLEISGTGENISLAKRAIRNFILY